MNLTMILIGLDILCLVIFFIILCRAGGAENSYKHHQEEEAIITELANCKLLTDLFEKAFKDCPLPYKMEVNSEALIIWKEIDTKVTNKNISHYYFKKFGMRNLMDKELYFANQVLYECCNSRYKNLYRFIDSGNTYQIIFDGF